MAFLNVENLHKKFVRSEVLRGIDFSMEKGEVLTIIGSSGSGKTTLLRCLNRLETPNVGKITVDGEVVFNAADHTKLKPEELRARRLHFGMVFQSFNLFPQYSVLNNLMLAPKLRIGELAREEKWTSAKKKEALAELETTARTLLERVGLADRAQSYPSELSGGQQQRVAIARALALKPSILCFDEPTSALDPELTGEVLKVIRGLKDDNCTMIVVTHEMEFARNVSDKVIFMANGVIEEMGTPDEVFGNPQSPKTRTFLQHVKM